MKKSLVILSIIGLLLGSCTKHEIPNIANSVTKEQIKQNVESVFGTEFDSTHDWCLTNSGTITITNIPSTFKKVQLMVYVAEDDSTTNMTVLNEAALNGESTISLAYDAPNDNLGLFVAFISETDYILKAVKSNEVSFGGEAKTRALSTGYVLPSVTPTVGGSEESFASQFGWLSNDGRLYYHTNYGAQKMAAPEYSDEYKAIFRTLIFSYFKNGRSYNNLPLVKRSGYYNASYYPFTTGSEPIIVSPVYKNDGGYKEIENCDLYYYYFRDSDVKGDIVTFINNLPKYKLLAFNECIKGDDVISKHAAYTVIYWGEGTPTEGTTGSYQFPSGYKIGFMIRSKYTGNQGDKRGELYGDGRLNNKVNAKKPFSSSKLGVDGPRMGWMTVNGRMLLCCESGTDTDFNDIILEVEGGVEPIIVIPDIEDNVYTFCFEDTPLGDYDLNDVVIKAKRINETTVEYSVIACGAYDKLRIKGINGRTINENTEVHALFGVFNEKTYINTEASGERHGYVTNQVTVGKNFSFLDEDTQPYIYDETNGVTVRLSKIGEDPHGIMIPNDFRYPLEKICIKNAYSQFNNWGRNKVTSTDWYLHPTEGKVWNF